MNRPRSAHGASWACALFGLVAFAGCVLYVPTDEFRRGSAADAAPGRDASTSSDAGPSAYRDLVLRDAPIAYWRLEETGGDVAHDETGKGHDAKYVGTFTFAVAGALTGENDKAVDFGGPYSAYLLVADATPFAFTGGGACSFEAWVRTRPSDNPYRKIFMQASRLPGGTPSTGWIFSLPTTGNGTLIEYDRYGASKSESAMAGGIPADTWTHVVLTYGSGATATIYVNGVSVGSKFLPLPLDPNGAAFAIGGNTDPPGGSYNGQMDELAVYDHELTAAQVLAHFRAARGGAP
jgi:hypothetical protein